MLWRPKKCPQGWTPLAIDFCRYFEGCFLLDSEEGSSFHCLALHGLSSESSPSTSFPPPLRLAEPSQRTVSPSDRCLTAFYSSGKRWFKIIVAAALTSRAGGEARARLKVLDGCVLAL